MVVYWNQQDDSTVFLDWARNARGIFYSMSLKEGYQNYPDSDLDGAVWPSEYFPRAGTFDKLIAAECKYNPETVIDVSQSAKLLIPRRC